MNRSDPSPVVDPATIIVLNGPSSSGKTSLAKAMQKASRYPLHHIQLDAFRAMEPPHYWDGWENRGETIVQGMMSALCGAMYAAALQYSHHGQQVVLDIALTSPHARLLLTKHFQYSPVHLIGVHCSVEELERRELARGDRRIGLARSQVDWLHKNMRYDFEADTTHAKPETIAAEILAWLDSSPSNSALSEVRALQNAA